MADLLNKITQGDCLEVMREITDKSVDMILCDLPYGTTRNKWDSVIPLDELWAQYERIIKDNGAIVLTAQTPFDKGAITESTGERYPITTLEFKRDATKVHPTQKPVALFEYLIRTYTNGGEVVLDNCMGSGTTTVAAINAGRQFVGIEREPEYVSIANGRIQDALKTKRSDV